MSRFYITLPSNSSMDYYPENTVAQYTTKLNNAMELDGEWEVGLAEISFPFEMENVLEGECYFFLYSDEDNTRKTITVPGGYYKTLIELLLSLEVAQEKDLAVSSEAIPVKFSWVNSERRVRMRISQPYRVDFSRRLARLLGFSYQTNYSNVGNYISKVLRPQVRTRIHSVYVYCDVVEHVAVGDTKAPLLRIVNKSSKGENVVHKTFNPPLYIPLQKKCFDTMEINLMTDTGQPVPFRFGKSFVVLEFRRAAYKYFAM